ncbi:Down syndrome cell adhesion molecule-like protein Dscam2 isoform X2 [Aphidius gifuensis]|uniref:Down syndrome cell adhesion molecule-like protein Dscam2 isoform X2 n=1 Tax=Aphidius gifuensis TaxID=684658 RepID=UPI001CDBA2F7|nr:Down syndrome cell adhesion molecule-like protein Dscam2 isoform X2 [Aphidius gifuensis]
MSRYLSCQWLNLKNNKYNVQNCELNTRGIQYHVELFLVFFSIIILLIPNCTASYEMQGPNFVVEPQSRVEFTNVNGGIVDCTVRGNPEPTVEWLGADGGGVATIPGIRIVYGNGTIHFPAFEAEAFRQDVHWAIYKCTAINSVGAVVSRDVTVRAVVNQRYDPEVQSLGGFLSNNVLMRCNVPSFVRDHVTVTSWLQEPSFNIYPSIVSDGKYHMLPNGDLMIINITRSDAQMTYRCRTHHRLTQETLVSRNIGRVQLTEVRGSTPPILNEKLLTMSGRLEDTVVIPCVAYANPPSTNRWYFRRDQREEPIDELSNHWTMHNGCLTIQGLQESDAGSYICSASNPEGSANLEVRLSVIAPLSVHVQPSVQTIDLGKPASLTCSASGFPQTAFYWLKDGQPLRTGDHISLLSRDKISVSSVAREDRGMYQCFVRNEHEMAQGIAELRLGEISPQLVYRFIEQTMQPGPSVSLKCSAAGNPTPQISWLLDGFHLPQHDRLLIGQYVTVYGDVISHVNITSVKSEDSGEYQCTASSRAGEASHSARLNVYGLPYVRPMPAVSAIAEQQLQIKCPVAGYPIESVTWEKNGTRLPTNMRQRVVNGTLTIETVQRNADQGTYTCIARNKHNYTSHRTVDVRVLVPPKITPFNFARDLNVGDRTSIQCVVVTGDLPLTFTWLKDNIKIISQDVDINGGINGNTIISVNEQKNMDTIWGNMKITNNPSDTINIRQYDAFTSALSVSTITPGHNGTYTCRVTNGASTVKHSALLLVNVPPRWIVEPIDQNAIVGHAVSVACQAEGFPIPTVTWKQSVGETPGDYRELGYGGTEGIGVSKNGSLVIPKVSRGHAGFYLCQGSNGIGPGLSKLIRLTVHAGPKVEVKTRQESARRGETAILRCDAKGDAPLEINWRNRAGRIEPIYDLRYTLENNPREDGLSSELRIIKTGHEDRGEYICTASNAYGVDKVTIHLLVQEPPNFPRNLHVAEQKSRSILLAWSSPSSDSDSLNPDSPITNYIVQYKEVDASLYVSEDMWHDHNTQPVAGDNTIALVSQLKPATSYHFRVFAENHLGTSAPSDILHVQTDGEIPSGPPKQVIVEPLGSQQLKITWQPPDRSLWNGELLGYTITFTVLGEDQMTNTTRVGISSNGDGSYEYRLNGLQKYTEYSIVVKAFNNKGDGPGSDPVVTRTLEAVPSSPPQNIACAALTGQNIQVTWKPPPSNKVHGIIKGYKLFYETTNGEPMEMQSSRDTKVTQALSTVLHDLRPYTNYSVQVLAYTRAGEGITSNAISCTTEETVPDVPEKVKSIPTIDNTVIISWLPPKRPNGVITKYTVYIRELDHGQEVKIIKDFLPAQSLYYEANGLKLRESYEAWVTASTKVGEGSSTPVIKLQPSSTVPAAIISFGMPIVTPWRIDVKLPCLSVGLPKPILEWRLGDIKLQKQPRLDFDADNTLLLRNVQRSQEGNYSCHVKNSLGFDEIVYSLQIQVPPTPPTLIATGTTTDAVQLQWKQGDNGGSPIKGFVLAFRKEFSEWEEVTLDRHISTHLLTGLQCGTKYQFTLVAFNRIGSGSASKVESSRTKGSKPIQPHKNHLIRTNITSVLLELSSWQDGGCPLLYFVVEYRRLPGDWLLVSNNVSPQQKFSIVNLDSGTSYELRVTAYNNAGSTQAEYLFNTPMPGGSTRSRDRINQGVQVVPLYLDAQVLAPSLISLIAVTLVVAGVCFCLRTHSLRGRETNDPNSQNQAALDNKHNMEQREQFYATVRKPGQQSPCREMSALERIPEYSEDIYPYATFHLPEQENLSGNPVRQAYFYERSDTMLQSSQNNGFFVIKCDMDQYTKIRGRSRRKSKSFKSESEEYDTLGSDSDTEVGTSSRTESSNHIEDTTPASMLTRSPGSNSGPLRGRDQRLTVFPRPVHHNMLYHTNESSTSTEPSPISERKTFPRLDKQRIRDITDDPSVTSSHFQNIIRPIPKTSERSFTETTTTTKSSSPSSPNHMKIIKKSNEIIKKTDLQRSVESLQNDYQKIKNFNRNTRSRINERKNNNWGNELSTLELKPPSGFTDPRETSEAECDIDMKLKIHRKSPSHTNSLSKSLKDFTITV